MSARASQMPPKIKSTTTTQLATLLKAAVRAHQTGHIKEAASGYRRILAINPHHPDALHLLGLLLHAQGNHEQAVRLVTAALQVAPRTAAFHATLAAIQLAKGDTAAAIATARRAVELDPNLLAAGNTLGNAHLRAGDAEAAVAVYRQLLLRAPNSPETLNNLGSALQVLGEIDEAACVLGRALEVKPDYAAAAANLALVRRDQGKSLTPSMPATAPCSSNPTTRLGALIGQHCCCSWGVSAMGGRSMNGAGAPRASSAMPTGRRYRAGTGVTRPAGRFSCAANRVWDR